MLDFSKELRANARYAEGFALEELTGQARLGLAVVTCIDTRIEPLPMLGLRPGDAKILRNAGARVTDDVIRSLAIASHLLGVRRVMLVAHTGCAMAGIGEEALRARLGAAGNVPALDGDLGTAQDQLATLAADVELLRNCGALHPDTVAAGFVYDVTSGRVNPIGDPGTRR